MKMATIQIPRKFEKGILQIKHSIECYSKSVGQPLTVAMGIQESAGEISINEAGELNQDEITALDNALFILNNHLVRSDPWKAKNDAEAELKANLAEIDNVFLG
jgi:hypothetical protein